jgi:UDPglucose 6-dehydrogenase
MNIAMIGSGYVGLVSGACFADFGHHVICVDANPARIDQLNRGELPIYEPGLRELVDRNRAARRLSFTTDLAAAVEASAVIFLAVGTPQGAGGEADLSQIEAAALSVAAHVRDYRVIVTKSTVPVGTGASLRRLVGARVGAGVPFDVVSNPEFLREGSAINDFLRPDRVVIGAESDRAAALLKEIYRPLYLIETPIVFTDLETAEMIKYAANAFLAVKIGFVNEIANLCERVGADVHVVAKGIGLDKRIGPKFLHPGPGYGGSCFPKDTRALAALGRRYETRQLIVESAIETNDRQRERVVAKIADAVGGLAGRRIAVLGLAFKPNTNDVREAPALFVCRRLARGGAAIRAFDPVARLEAAEELADVSASIAFTEDSYEAAAGAHAVVIMTEWNEFRGLDLERLREVMAEPVLIDVRNVFDPAQVRQLGFTYHGTGRGVPRETGVMA